MGKKSLGAFSQDQKKMRLMQSAFALVSSTLVFGIAGCASVTRSPAPSESYPVENAEQLSPGTLPPQDISGTGSIKKNDGVYNQNQASYHFSMGQAYSLEGDADKAIEEYKVALIYDSNSAVVHTRLASEYVKKGLLTFAIEQCKIAVKLDPKYVDARLLLAGLYSSTKLTKEALEQYDTVLKLEPKNSEAYVFKGSLLLDEGRINESVAVLKALVDQDPEYYLGYYYLARAYHQQNKTDAAIQNYRKALEIKPNFTQAGLTLGILFEEKKRMKEALKVYEELYESSGDMQAVARLAQIYIDKGDYEKALKHLTHLAQSDEDNLNVRVKIGLIHIERKEYAQAVEVFKQILEKNSDAERVRYYLGSVYEEMKEYSDAISEFKKISTASTVYVDATIHVAHLYKLKGENETALTWVEEAVGKNPTIPQFHLYRAALLEEMKRLPEAVASLEKSRQQFPREEKLLYYLGSLYDKQAMPDKAVSVMEDLLDVNPDNPHALNYIAYSYALKRTKLDQAETMLKKAMKLKPGDGYIQDSYGFLLMVKGDVRQATIELEKAMSLRPDEGIIAEHLGDAYLKGNLKHKAMQRYLDAAKLYTDSPEKEKVERKILELKRVLGENASDAPTKNSRVPAQLNEQVSQ